jgi:hypothetical protein
MWEIHGSVGDMVIGAALALFFERLARWVGQKWRDR